MLRKAVIEGGGSEPEDRLVNASSNGNFQDVREILEANPGKVINRSIDQSVNQSFDKSINQSSKEASVQ